MKLWLVRHGQTEANVAGLYSGHSETALTAQGMRQATEVGQLLSGVTFDRVLCSALGRAKHTAHLMLEGREQAIEINPLLNEMHFGDWEMRHHRDLQHEDAVTYAAWCQDWQNTVPTNGEGFQSFSQRILSLSEELRAMPQENILVVSHQGVLSLLIATLMGMPPPSLWHFMIEQGSWSMVEIHQNFVTLRTLNNRAAAVQGSGEVL
ncbi:adenosylcobalamin/alpha-ribazole phosphatase [Atlantibacter hermannii]|uniref:adenosylcobalamin/alpha-ribazole phosphatase n=1 Tax=Atlantibacter hermannii TaxID=565 RepID=UPI000ED9C4BF|nr:adenosylcobalamin/alpha-ribazole phosphatase [Atlantibacter hermannii]MDW4576178.1 adenosylcobalamin/alpha-ribazole phosphatase [Atlantibacter hermannii]HAP82314.1 alpha-ribazole phosphatase [Enterobacteriaceae bacterium]